MPDARWKKAFTRKLRAWFDEAKRDLPWRRSRDPYRIWISEIMLQQTQVAAVIDYFNRFLAAFPTVAELAAAPEREVLRLWEGLGYYRRARQLHLAAQQIVGEHGGAFPRDPVAVRALPGIGRYTAGAVCSIAYDLPEPILEANTVRLLSRLSAYRDDPLAKAGQDHLWAWAGAIVPREEPGLFNQALMELGALVCTPREPRCVECPVAGLCAARKLGLEREIPQPKAKKEIEAVREAAVLVRQRNKVLLVERAAGERWGGLWDFPRYSVVAEQPENIRVGLQAEMLATLGIEVAVGERLHTLKHGVTRFRITLEAYAGEYVRGKLKPEGFAAARWVKPSELAEYPLNVTARKLTKLLDVKQQRLGFSE
ncbi:MAG: A/G-specific adenine glycosylase [Planctomycetia bacterium]|nr:A/G-specific adenine glycosylase [Planctomycetia bacterium]